MNSNAPDPLERRLRLLVAREFAARGYCLDVEGMYEHARTDAMTPEELELLAKVAALSGDWAAAERRFELLGRRTADAAELSRWENLAAFARAQRGVGGPASRCRRWPFWPVVVGMVIAIAVVLCLLWAMGQIGNPAH